MTQLVNVGDVLAGKYRVDQVLGIGGMGMVVAATHLELEQRVAIKLMLPKFVVNAQALDRFLREAKAAVKLRGDHVCRVLDVARLDSGAPYIVMELMEGEDFAQLLSRRGPLPVADACAYVLQALEGLAEAHGSGIVHRDLKPGNLFVTSATDGSPLVKLLDFGISKSQVAGGVATRTGDFMGSPVYMAPEQMVSAKNVDARADQWAIGVILYEAITGRVPFEAETVPALCMAVMNQPPIALDARERHVPAALSSAVMRCLEKVPGARFADVGELAAALAPFGPPGARDRAARVARVLHRAGQGTGGEPSVDSPRADSAPDPAHADTAEPQRISTLRTSAAEVGARRPKRDVKTIWFAGGAVLAAGAVITVVVMNGASTPSSAQVPAPLGSSASGSAPPEPIVRPIAGEPATSSAPAPAAPAPVASAGSAAPAPAPHHAPAKPPQNVPPTELEPLRIAGDKSIPPSDATAAEIAASGKPRVIGTFKLCLDARGHLGSVTQLESTGFPAYDERIASTIRSSWSYRPFLIDGRAAPVCTAVTFVYKPPAVGAGAAPPVDPECASVHGLEHEIIDVAKAGAPLRVEARVGSDLAAAAKVAVRYRPENAVDFTEIEMTPQGHCTYAAVIPASAMHGSLLHYFVAVYGGNGRPIASKGSAGSPNIVEVSGRTD